MASKTSFFDWEQRLIGGREAAEKTAKVVPIKLRLKLIQELRQK
jgi:hypothetical protein